MSEGKRPMTNVAELLGELNGGTVEQILNIALTDTAANVQEFGRDGTVLLKIKLKKIGDSNQVNAIATVDYKMPTKRGNRGEDYAVDTPLFVGRGGRLTVLPETQVGLFTGKTRDEADRDDLNARKQH